MRSRIFILFLLLFMGRQTAFPQVCPALFSIYGYGIKATSVKVYWSSANATTYYVYKLKLTPPTSGQWELATSTGGLNADVTGLSPSSAYQFAVRAVCTSGAYRDYIDGFTVTTFATDPPTCPVPNTLLTTQVGSFNAYVRSDLITYAIGWTFDYTIYYREQNVGAWRSVKIPIDNPNTPNAQPRFPVLLPGLLPNRTYEWFVQDICSQYGVGSSGAFSAVATFTTQPEQPCYGAYAPSAFVWPPRDACYPWIGYCPGSWVYSHGRYSSASFFHSQALVTPEMPTAQQFTAITNSAPQYVDLLPGFEARMPWPHTMYEANTAPYCTSVITQFRQAGETGGATETIGSFPDTTQILPPYLPAKRFNAATNNTESALTVYPNPTTGICQFSIKGTDETIRQTEIIDGTGKTVYQSAEDLRRIDIGFLPQGLYYYFIRTTKATYKGKLVKVNTGIARHL